MHERSRYKAAYQPYWKQGCFKFSTGQSTTPAKFKRFDIVDKEKCTDIILALSGITEGQDIGSKVFCYMAGKMTNYLVLNRRSNLMTKNGNIVMCTDGCV